MGKKFCLSYSGSDDNLNPLGLISRPQRVFAVGPIYLKSLSTNFESSVHRYAAADACQRA
jgi:hypothetical protein